MYVLRAKPFGIFSYQMEPRGRRGCRAFRYGWAHMQGGFLEVEKGDMATEGRMDSASSIRTSSVGQVSGDPMTEGGRRYGLGIMSRCAVRGLVGAQPSAASRALRGWAVRWTRGRRRATDEAVP